MRNAQDGHSADQDGTATVNGSESGYERGNCGN
jgi:hypothetical protein